MRSDVVAIARIGSAQQQIGNQPGPSGLMRGTEAPARLGVKVFVKRDGIAEVGPRVRFDAGHHGTYAVTVLQEDRGKPRRYVIGDCAEVRLPPGPARIFDSPRIAEEAVVDAQRLDDQVVDRKPDRPTPVRVAAVKARGRTPPGS